MFNTSVKNAYGNTWLEVLVRSLDAVQFSPFGEELPPFPSKEMQCSTTGLSSEAALEQAFAFYEDVQKSLTSTGVSLDPESQVLDFGFGWGRISRVFMKDVRKTNIHGIDVDPDFVALTREHFGSDNFQTCDVFPPTTYPDSAFDLIYAYSVFSHLSEKACREWMAEFRRILRPGGVVAFTTRHDSFFDRCAQAAKEDPDNEYFAALGRLFPDIQAAKDRYYAGEFVHAPSEGVGGGGPRDSSFYGETWIPEAYVRQGFGTDLQFIAGSFDASSYDQAFFALRRQ